MGCKWVYTVKYTTRETLEKYKVRLVAKRYTYIYIYDMNYLETFAHVGKINIIKVSLLLPTNYIWDLQRFDVKNAFLNGNLEKR